MTRTRKVFQPEEFKPFANAICEGIEMSIIAKQFNCAIGTVRNYVRFASGYAAGVEKGETTAGRADCVLAIDTFRGQGEGIIKEIIENIRNGYYFTNKKAVKPRGPLGYARTSNPIKEEGPAVVQQKLPLQNPGCSEKQGPVSRNAVDVVGIIKQMLDKSMKETEKYMEETKTLRALVEKLKIG